MFYFKHASDPTLRRASRPPRLIRGDDRACGPSFCILERGEDADLNRWRGRELSMNHCILRVIAMTALASGVIVGGDGQMSARASAAPAVLPRPPLVLAQAPPVPAAPTGPVLAPEQRIGLPPVRDYEQIPELRDIYFDFGKAVIRPAEVKTLEANAAWLRDHPGHLVLIEGHCDNRGATHQKNEFNMDLGERRAQAAMNYLIALGVDPSRITILSYGEERPRCTEESERCWRQNRRSRFLVKPR
jgi:peptidoglycan-associated lipoprotein